MPRNDCCTRCDRKRNNHNHHCCEDHLDYSFDSRIKNPNRCGCCDDRRKQDGACIHYGRDDSSGRCCSQRLCEKITQVNMPLISENEGVIANTDNPFRVQPADPINAVGRTRQIVVVNVSLAILIKATQEKLYLDSFNNFFDDQIVSFFDPWVVYDELSDRFFITITAQPFPPTRLFIAVSKNGEPNSADDFYKYTYTVPGFFDYQKMAVDRDAMYVSATNVQVPGSIGILFQRIIAFRKSSLLVGGPPEVVFEDLSTPDPNPPPPGSANIGGAQWQWFPAQPQLDKCRPYQVYFIQNIVNPINVPFPQILTTSFTGSQIRVMTVENVLTNPTIHIATLDVEPFSSLVFINPPFQPPPLINPPPRPIAALSHVPNRIQSAIVNKGSIWAAFTTATDNDTRALARWYQVNVSHLIESDEATLIQQGSVETGQGDHTYFPAINVDKDGNMGISFSISSPKRYISIGYTGRLKCDPLGTVRLPVHIALAGEIYYQIGSGIVRFGDYSGLAIDPCDHKTFWLYNMYPIAVPIPSPTSAFNFGADWSTFLGAYQINKGCPDLITAPQTQGLQLGNNNQQINNLSLKTTQLDDDQQYHHLERYGILNLDNLTTNNEDIS